MQKLNVLPVSRDAFLILTAFFISRLLFFFWLTGCSSVYNSPNYNGREPSALQDGLWVEDVQRIVKGEIPTVSEDVGMTYFMTGLHLLGVPIKQTFFWACLALSGCAAIFLFYFYKDLKNNKGSTAAFLITLALVLYPPGIYYSFFNMLRILPAHAFLAGYVLIAYAPHLFERINFQRILLFAGIALYFSFLIMARKSNNVIVLSTVIGLALRLYSDKAALRRFAFFLIVLGMSYGGSWIISRNNQHLVWHSLYHGLADFDRKHGFQNADIFSEQAALKEKPDLLLGYQNIYENPAYDKTLKKLYFRAVAADPFWYAKILIFRTLKLIVFPFQGSWVVPVASDLRERTITLGDLFDGTAHWQNRIYIAVKTLTGSLDLMLTFLGFLGISIFLYENRKKPGEFIPYILILSSALYAYIIIGTGNRTVYVTGTYFYLFFSLDLLRRIVSHAPWMASPTKTKNPNLAGYI